ncbi:MAG: TolC family protein [bacterium]
MNTFFVLLTAALLPICVFGQSEIIKLTLNEAIEIGLRNNPEVRIAAENISASRGRFWSGISLPRPEVGISYEYVPKGSPVKHFGERMIGISQSFDFPTTILFRGMQLSSHVSIAEAEHSSTAAAITSRVKVAYYNMLARQKKIVVKNEFLALANDFARKAEIRYTVGEATNLERLTAAVQYTQARNALAVAQNDLKVSLGELFFALGLTKQEQPDDVILTDTLIYQPITTTLEELTARALSINPQLKASSGRIAVASLSRTLAWSSILPSFSASYYRQTVANNSNYYGVSLGASIPLWFLFDQRGQIQEASANLSIAESDFRSLNNYLITEVRNAYLEVRNNERQIQLLQTDILPQAEEVYRTALASYTSGEITYIEYLQARQILISSRNEYIDELARYYSSLSKLEYAVGTSIIQ